MSNIPKNNLSKNLNNKDNRQAIKKVLFNKEKIDQLSQERILQKNVVYVIGLSPKIANKETLQKQEYFGQYGNILKILTNKTKIFNQHIYYENCHSSYIYYSCPKEASLAILAVDNFKIDNHYLKTSFGRTKYCSYFLRNLECLNKDCFYLHKLAEKDDVICTDDSKLLFHEQHLQAIKISNLYDVDFKKKILAQEAKKNIETVFPKISEIYNKYFVIETLNENNLNFPKLNEKQDKNSLHHNINENLEIICNENAENLNKKKNEEENKINNNSNKEIKSEQKIKLNNLNNLDKENKSSPPKVKLADLFRKKKIIKKNLKNIQEKEIINNKNDAIEKNSLEKLNIDEYINLNSSKSKNFHDEIFIENSQIKIEKNILPIKKYSDSSNSSDFNLITNNEMYNNSVLLNDSTEYITKSPLNENINSGLILKNSSCNNKNIIIQEIKFIELNQNKEELIPENNFSNLSIVECKNLETNNKENTLNNIQKKVGIISDFQNNNIKQLENINKNNSKIGKNKNFSINNNLENKNFNSENKNTNTNFIPPKNNYNTKNISSNESNKSDPRSSILSSTTGSISPNISLNLEWDNNSKTPEIKVKRRRSIYTKKDISRFDFVLNNTTDKSENKSENDKISNHIPDFVFDILNKKISRFTFFKRFEKEYEINDSMFLENQLNKDKDDSWTDFIKLNLNP